ncbi:MAG: type II CRISPR-associated endonuclease Cas1 [Atopobiaceae bacterium]|nr:type II CRISPR-associated endonuclease Cas1 [Atopobiaceae bacterium]
MAYRVVTIENPAEVHVQNGQLTITQDKGTASIPVKDIEVLIVSGPGIRMSTMAQTKLSQAKVVILFLGLNHHPAALTLPMVGHSRQARIMQTQAGMSPQLKAELWRLIVIRKIENQARVLAILGMPGAEEVWERSLLVLPGDADNREGDAAKRYFQYLHPGLNRRTEDPVNSALNYCYAIIRALIARELVAAGFSPALGLHHRSQMNPFNLVDDVMEPFRPCADLVVEGAAGRAVRLTRKQRTALRQVCFSLVLIDGRTVDVITAARLVAESLRKAILMDFAPAITLPTVLPIASDAKEGDAPCA